MGYKINVLGPPFDLVGSTGTGSGDVTHTGTLTAHEVILGNGGADIKALGSLGSAGQVLTSGGVGVDPSWTSAGSGTIGGTIAATQVAFGTGTNAIGGSANFTWDGTVAAFTEAHGVSFDGPGAPITLIGGDDGAGGTLLSVESADGFVSIVFPQDSGLFGVGSTLTVQADVNVDVQGGVAVRTLAPEVQILLAPDSLANPNQILWQEFIHAGSTQYNEVAYQQFAYADTGTDFFESFMSAGAKSAGGTQLLFGQGAFGHYTAGGTLTDYGYYLFDFVQDKALLEVVSTAPNTVAFGVGYSVFARGFIETETGFIVDGGYLQTSTTSAAALTFQAYDEDNATYRTFATLTNANTPTFVITPPSGGTVTVNATTLQQGGNSISLAGSFTTSGAFAVTQTYTGATNVTFPTSGTLLTTTGDGTGLTFPGTLSIASGKTLTSSNTLTLAGTDGKGINVGAATSGKILVGDGTNMVLSTPTFPNASATSGKFIRSDGTNWIASTPTLPTSAGSAGKVLASDGTNYVESTPTFPYTSAGATGGIIQSDGTNWVRRSRVIACSGTASSSLTGTTNETNLAVVTITGGIMGANSSLVITTLWKFTGTAGTKNRVVRVSTSSGDVSGGTLYCNFAGSNTNLSSLQQTIIWNANSTSSQIGNENGQQAGSANTNPTSSINTGSDFYINLNGKLSNTGDTEQLVGYIVELVTP